MSESTEVASEAATAETSAATTAETAATTTESASAMDTDAAAPDTGAVSGATPALTKEQLPDITKEELIAPPPELRSIVDVTVDYVVRNGINFEGELRKRQQSNRKFDFLIPGNPYYKWYKWKLQCKIDPKAAEEAKKMAAEEKAAKDELLKETKLEREKAKDSIKVVELTLSQRIEQEMKLYKMCKEETKTKLPDPKCSVPLPVMVTPFDVDLIKLTAQFVARNGRQFVSALTQSQHQMNQRYHFLNPVDTRFPYFQKLVQAYNECIVLPKDLIGDLEKDLDADKLYQTCLGHAVFAVEEAESKAKAAADVEAEEIAMRLIDWNDFAIVESITFDTENEYYPAPGKDIDAVNELLDMENRKEINVVLADDVESDMEVEMAIESSDEEELAEADGTEQVQKIEQSKEEPTKEAAKEEPSKPAVPEYKGTDTIVTADLGGEIRLETAENTQLRQMLERDLLVSNTSGGFVKCPVTGQMVESSRLGEHIRISLLDPKWKEQRDHLLSRMQKSSLAGNADIVRNLGTFQREHDLIMRGGDAQGAEAPSATAAAPVDPVQAARLREAEEQAKLRKQLRQQAGGEPPAKRRRPNMVPSAQWLAAHPGPQTLQVQVGGKFHQITLSVAKMVMDLKVQIQAISGLDPSKQQITTSDGVVLDNDGVALADFNLQTASQLTVTAL